MPVKTNRVIANRVTAGPGALPVSNINLAVTDPYQALQSMVRLEEFVFPSQSLTVIDSGGASGGWVATQIGTMPATDYAVLGAFATFNVTGVTGGLNGNTQANFGMGIGPTGNGTLNGTNDDNLVALIGVSLTSGVGNDKGTGPPGGNVELVDGAAITGLYLNIGFADANISADGDITFSGVFRMYYLDLGRGLA